MESETSDTNGGAEDYSHLFRSEVLLSDVDLQVDVAASFTRLVAGDEQIEVDADRMRTRGTMTLVRGARIRHAGRYERIVEREEVVVPSQRVTETVHGGVEQRAKFAAEAMIGGAYLNTMAGPYTRLAGWVDYLAWGGWAEVDTVRTEIALTMIRSHVGYAHAAGCG